MKKIIIILMAVITLFVAPICAQARHFDFAILGSRHSVDVNVSVDESDFVALIKSQGNSAIFPLQKKGDMSVVGDFEREESKRSYSEIGIGYRLGSITPFVGYGTRGITIIERIVIKNEVTGKNEIVSKSTKDTDIGIVFGVSFDAQMDRIGLLVTLAKAPEGLYGEAKVKYFINDRLALLGGGIYHPSINAKGIILGLGVSY